MSDDTKPGSVLPFPGGQKEQASLAQLVSQMRESLPSMLEFHVLNAQITRRRFTALVDAGFTQEQALELCKGQPT